MGICYMLKGNAELFCLSWTKKCVVPESGVFNMWLYHKAHKLLWFLMCSFFFFFCIIAKPKNKSPSKLDKTFPFLCKPKTKCGREGEGKGATFCWKLLLFWKVSHSHCEKVFSPSLFCITDSSGHPFFCVFGSF